MPGYFVISLDFELFWGVKDHRSKEDYGRNILGARTAIPQILDLFNKKGVHASWATVGFLFYDNKKELLDSFPAVKPEYWNYLLSNYNQLGDLGESEVADPYHYGKSLIKLIRSTPYQEIETHTFSHYYCLEAADRKEAFKDDLKATVKAATEQGISLRSIVFPRNQVNMDYMEVLRENGIIAYRGNPKSYFYDAGSQSENTWYKRIVRLLDTYLPLVKVSNKSLKEVDSKKPVDIAASRFLRPYSSKLSFLETLKIKRIKNEMYDAAINNKIYHLWWHPHNFGTSINENMFQLEELLDWYIHLNERFGMQSATMSELALEVLNSENQG